MYYPYFIHPPEKVQKKILRLQAAFQEMDRLVREAGGMFGVIIVPELFQVDSTRLFRPTKQSPNVDALDLEKPQREFATFFTAVGIKYFDLLSVFRTQSVENTYFLRDRHWTAEGHQVAARTLAGFLKEAGLLLSAKPNCLP